MEDTSTDFLFSRLLLSVQKTEERHGWLFPKHPATTNNNNNEEYQQRSNLDDDNHKTDNSPPVDSIRHMPEIMLHVYSYLPIKDRILRLALVDRTFHQDKVRAGVLCATYGGRYSLTEALEKLMEWAKKESSSGMQRKARRTKIGKMRQRVHLSTSLYEYFDTDTRRRTKPHWLDDIVDMRTSLKRYYYDGNFNRLAQLMTDEDFETTYKVYVKNVQEVQKRTPNWDELLAAVANGTFNNSSTLDRILPWTRKSRFPRLDPSCSLFLLDGKVDDDESSGWTEHRAVSCCTCSKVVFDFTTKICQNGYREHFCQTCTSPAVSNSFQSMFHRRGTRRQRRARSFHAETFQIMNLDG